MEAAGLALSILPLIIAAADNYKKLFLTPFCRYHSFADEAGRYVIHLKNQQAIFETQCIHLLAHVTAEEMASAIINAPNERSPTYMRQVGERLEFVLRCSHDALILTMEAINHVLAEIQKDSDRLSCAVKIEEEATKQFGRLRLLTKEWKHHVRQKLKFSFSGSQLSTNLKVLTQLNQEFSTISDFVLRPPPLSAELISGMHGSSRLVLEHRAIGEAAEAICANMSRLSCSSYEPHLADLSVGNEMILHSEHGPSSIEFDATFYCPTSCSESLKFSVSGPLVDKSFHHRVVEQDKLQSALTSTLRLDPELAKDLQQTQEPRTAFEARRSISPENIAPEQGSDQQGDSVQDGKFCEFLSLSIKGLHDGDLSIRASLAHDTRREAGVSMNRKGKNITHHEVFTLAEVLDLPQDAPRRMPIPKRLWLAKTLAIAFFRYHHTGWAGLGWESKMICFHTSDAVDTCQSSNLYLPWLRCGVRNIRASTSHGLVQSGLLRSGLTRNKIDLFALGALLIEIGCSMNWTALSDTHPNSEDDILKSFFRARHLLGQGLWDMGGTYRTIVEKLIESVFANGYDLDDQKSQGMFIEEVIRPLEEEERELRRVVYGSAST